MSLSYTMLPLSRALTVDIDIVEAHCCVIRERKSFSSNSCNIDVIQINQNVSTRGYSSAEQPTGRNVLIYCVTSMLRELLKKPFSLTADSINLTPIALHWCVSGWWRVFLVEGSPVHSGAEHTVRDLKNDLTWTTPLSGKYTSVLLITCKN